MAVFEDVERNGDSPTAESGQCAGYHSSAEADLAGLEIHEKLISKNKTKKLLLNSYSNP